MNLILTRSYEAGKYLTDEGLARLRAVLETLRGGPTLETET